MVAGQTITVRVNKSDAAEGEEPYTETNIEVTDEMTIRELNSQLQSAGLNANFDQATGRFYISAKRMSQIWQAENIKIRIVRQNRLRLSEYEQGA